MSELWSRPLPLAALSLGVLWVLVWLPRRIVAAPSLTLLRCLVPAWRFFEEIEPVPALRYRVAPNGDDWNGWQDALTIPARTLGSLWLNAAGNLHLARQSLIEHLVADITDGVVPAGSEHELVSYQLVHALIEERIRSAQPMSPALRFQFCLSAVESAAAESAVQPVSFVSRVHSA